MRTGPLLGLAVALAGGALPQRSVIDPRVAAVDEELKRAETAPEYGQVKARALALMAAADKAHEALVAFQSAVIAADCTYFSTPEARQSQDEAWANAEAKDLHQAATRYTDEVKQNWFNSRQSYERYANLLAASASHMAVGGLSVVRPGLKPLFQQLAADAEKTIPTTFSYREMVWLDNIETGRNLARLSWEYGSRDIARGRFQHAIDETRDDGRIDLWLQLEEERYNNERSVNPPAVPLQQLREEARLGAQGLRESYSSRAGRIWVNALFDQAYGPMLKDQMWEKGASTPAEIFRATESLKARTLLDELSAPPAELAESTRPPAEALETDVLGFSPDKDGKDTMFAQEIKLISLLSPFDPGESQIKRLASLARLEQIYQKGAAGFTMAAKPASLERVQNALQAREAILEYVIPYDAFYPDQYLTILWITHDAFVPVHFKLDDIIPRTSGTMSLFKTDREAPVTLSPFRGVVAKLREEIRSDNDKEARIYLNDLYKVLIEPLLLRGLKLENYDRLIIVPHGPLHYVPFGALLDDEGKFLVEKTAVTIVPSASVWLLLQEKPGAPVRNFVAFGNPALNRPDLSALPAAESEVKKIADELDIPGAGAKHIYIREHATEERFLRDGPGASLLHLATHGEFPDENALDRHAVILAAGKSGDGVLNAAVIRKVNLSSNRLVVLSVCNGGLYRIGPADEPYGLIPAFLQAGSQNAVGTLWKVEDIYGRLLMAEFYKSVLKAGPAEALRQASKEFIGQGQTISRWSGFVAVGPGRPF